MQIGARTNFAVGGKAGKHNFQSPELDIKECFLLYPLTNKKDKKAEFKTGKFAHIAERAGRAQDKEDGGGLETLRREGYM